MPGQILEDSYIAQFLARFGYDSVDHFQLMNGLNPDGIVGPKTAAVLTIPRCGVTEAIVGAATQIWAWKREAGQECLVHYFIQPGLATLLRMPEAELDEVMRDAFETAWPQHCNLRFVRALDMRQRRCINVFGKRLDGPSSILAQCELPVDGDRACRMDIDTSEDWVKALLPDARGILIGAVVKHEAGHGIGLTHSRMPNALMAPTYSAAIVDPQANDDIARVQMEQRYGKRPAPLPKPPTVPPVGPANPPGRPPIEQLTLKMMDGTEWRWNLKG